MDDINAKNGRYNEDAKSVMVPHFFTKTPIKWHGTSVTGKQIDYILNIRTC